MKIKKGTPIKWKSTAQRRINPYTFADGHEGIYMAYLESQRMPETVCPELVGVSSGCKKFGHKNGTSQVNRVIAKVLRSHAITGEPMQPHWYGPRVSAVTHAFLEGQWVEIDPKQIEWE